jgi:16S rRNA (uracil1498-N3)-methyltransferase
MSARFYVPNLNPSQGRAELSAVETHHLVKVLRLEPGATIGVFDGRGTEWRARVETVGRPGARVTLLEPVASPRPSVEITLVQAVLKGEPMDDVIRDCTMVGVAHIQPVLTSRTSVKVSTMADAVERWRRVALASAKQCGAARLPEITNVVPLADWYPRDALENAFVLVEPSVTSKATTIRELASRTIPSHATLLVGPEGGWSEAERDRAVTAGCAPLSLGRMTLRAAAVPLAATAALLSVWESDHATEHHDP